MDRSLRNRMLRRSLYWLYGEVFVIAAMPLIAIAMSAVIGGDEIEISVADVLFAVFGLVMSRTLAQATTPFPDPRYQSLRLGVLLFIGMSALLMGIGYRRPDVAQPPLWIVIVGVLAVLTILELVVMSEARAERED